MARGQLGRNLFDKSYYFCMTHHIFWYNKSKKVISHHTLFYVLIMLCLTTNIASYILLITIVIPFSFRNATDDEHYVEDYIMLVVMLCAALVDVCHDIINQHTNER